MTALGAGGHSPPPQHERIWCWGLGPPCLARGCVGCVAVFWVLACCVLRAIAGAIATRCGLSCLAIQSAIYLFKSAIYPFKSGSIWPISQLHSTFLFLMRAAANTTSASVLSSWPVCEDQREPSASAALFLPTTDCTAMAKLSAATAPSGGRPRSDGHRRCFACREGAGVTSA